ncbi:MAG: hypothetical protein K2K69_03860 [Muribaculaceae bacterium]|nr:hypothetical protein [Muribaculaceae bacterium]
MRISYSIPDDIARRLESKCTRIGYPSSRAFLRALTLWAAARLGEQTPEAVQEYDEEVKAMFAELSATEAPVYGNKPKRQPKRTLD